MVAPTIRSGNGIEVLGEKEYHFDAETIGPSGTFCVSHAHSDHLPKRFIGRQVVCSEVTARCLNVRTKKTVDRYREGRDRNAQRWTYGRVQDVPSER